MMKSRPFLFSVAIIFFCIHSGAVDVGRYWNGLEIDEKHLENIAKSNGIHAPKMLAAHIAYLEISKTLTEYDLVFHKTNVIKVSPTRYTVVFNVPIAECKTCTFNKLTFTAFDVDLQTLQASMIDPTEFSYGDLPTFNYSSGKFYEDLVNGGVLYAPLIPVLAAPLKEFSLNCDTICLQNYAVSWKVKPDALQVYFASFSYDKSTLDTERYAEYWVRRSTRKLMHSKTRLVGTHQK